MRAFLAVLLAAAFLLPTSMTFAESSGEVVLVDPASGAIAARFSPFDGDPVGSIAAADLGTDGIAEIIVGAASGKEPTVAVYRQDGSKITSFLAYAATFRGGVNVAACDIDGDGRSEIITGAQFGGGPHVRIFDGAGSVVSPGFFAYDATFRGGVNVACGDVNGDGAHEIITGAGLTGGPHLKVFSVDGTLMHEAFNGSAAQNTGAFVAVGNLDGDNDDEILAASMGSDSGVATSFDLRAGKLAFRSAVTTAMTTRGTPLFATDVNNDGNDDIGASSNGANAMLITYAEVGTPLSTLTPFAEHSSLRAATVSDDILAVAQSTNILYDDTSAKSILIDVSDQRLTAYEYGVPVNAFLVSTGLRGFDTPLGKTDVKEKLLWHDYVWSYGVNDARNYNIPDVKYNLRIYKHIYIHYAYWHNNFGNRMSHGCVNVNYANAEWIYNWADVGTPVNIIP